MRPPPSDHLHSLRDANASPLIERRAEHAPAVARSMSSSGACCTVECSGAIACCHLPYRQSDQMLIHWSSVCCSFFFLRLPFVVHGVEYLILAPVAWPASVCSEMGLCAARSIGHDFLSSNSYFNHYKIPNISAVVSWADNDFRIISSHKLLHEKLCVSETP
jgi:hypothetical protein